MNNLFMRTLYPGYIKKEDAKRILKSRETYPLVILSAMAMLFGVMQLFIQPRLNDLVSDFGSDLPIYNSPLVGLVLLIIAAIFLFPNKKTVELELEKKLAKYKTGEIILAADLIDHNQEWKSIAVVVVFTGYIVISNILPIYNLTSAF